MIAPTPTAELERLKARARKLAEEKSYLELVIHLIKNLNPLPGIADMVRNLQCLGRGSTFTIEFRWLSQALMK